VECWSGCRGQVNSVEWVEWMQRTGKQCWSGCRGQVNSVECWSGCRGQVNSVEWVECWSAGVLECWSAGVLVEWCSGGVGAGVLECWRGFSACICDHSLLRLRSLSCISRFRPSSRKVSSAPALIRHAHHDSSGSVFGLPPPPASPDMMLNSRQQQYVQLRRMGSDEGHGGY
jgi:hypothetical protein